MGRSICCSAPYDWSSTVRSCHGQGALVDPVIIAGAGPVGLALALALARQQVPVVVLDEGSGVAPEGVRSTVLRADTAAFLARIGYPRAAADARAWAGWRMLRRDRELWYLPLNPEEDAPAEALHLSQHRLLRGLRDAVSATGLVELVTDSAVLEVEQDPDGVTVRSERTWWRGSHLVGCDGPRSTVRKQLRVRFPGRPAADRYAVATIRSELPFPGEARLHRDPPHSPHSREVTARPLPDAVWRLDFRLPLNRPPLAGEELVEQVRATLTEWTEGGVPGFELIAAADWTVQQRLATRFQAGRVFLAGDAAHVLGAVGMQALDEGLRDADNLAWKLSQVWHGWAPERLLTTYQQERRGAVIARLRAVDQSMPLLQPGSALREARRSLMSGSLRRNAALLSDGTLGAGQLGGPPGYPGGGRTALSEELAPTEPGALAPDVPVITTDGTRDTLRARLGTGFTVLLVAPGTSVWASEHWLGAGLMPKLAEATRALPVPAELLVTEAYPGAGAHTVLLLRPDGHVVATMAGCRPGELLAATESARDGGPELPAARGERRAPQRRETAPAEPESVAAAGN